MRERLAVFVVSRSVTKGNFRKEPMRSTTFSSRKVVEELVTIYVSIRYCTRPMFCRGNSKTRRGRVGRTGRPQAGLCAPLRSLKGEEVVGKTSDRLHSLFFCATRRREIRPAPRKANLEVNGPASPFVRGKILKRKTLERWGREA